MNKSKQHKQSAKDRALEDIANLEDDLESVLAEAESCVRAGLKDRGLPTGFKALQAVVGRHYFGDKENSIALKAYNALSW